MLFEVSELILLLKPGKLFRSGDLDLDVQSYTFTCCIAAFIKILISVSKFGMFRVQVLNIADIGPCTLQLQTDLQ